jgi:hypothetical protein
LQVRGNEVATQNNDFGPLSIAPGAGNVPIGLLFHRHGDFWRDPIRRR